jgi:hypothetical protein
LKSIVFTVVAGVCGAQMSGEHGGSKVFPISMELHSMSSVSPGLALSQGAGVCRQSMPMGAKVRAMSGGTLSFDSEQ